MKALYTVRPVTRWQVVRSVIRDSGERLEPAAIGEFTSEEAATQVCELLTSAEAAQARRAA